MTTEERKQKGRKPGISIEYIITWNKQLMNEERSIDNNNTRVLIMKKRVRYLALTSITVTSLTEALLRFVTSVTSRCQCRLPSDWLNSDRSDGT